MGLSFYNIPRSQACFHSTNPTPPGATQLDTIQTATVWSLELGKIKEI